MPADGDDEDAESGDDGGDEGQGVGGAWIWTSLPDRRG